MRLHRPLLISLVRNERTTARRLPMPRELISQTNDEMNRETTGRFLPMKAARRINVPN